MTTPKQTWSKARKRFYDQRRVYRIFNQYGEDSPGAPLYVPSGMGRFTDRRVYAFRSRNQTIWDAARSGHYRPATDRRNRVKRWLLCGYTYA